MKDLTFQGVSRKILLYFTKNNWARERFLQVDASSGILRDSWLQLRKKGRKYSVRIVEVITGGEPGGAQRHVAELVTYLIAQGHEVAIIHGGGKWLSQAVSDKAEVYYLSQLKREISFQDTMAFSALRALILKLSPNVVHAHSSKAGILCRLIGWREKIPVVYTAHGFVFVDPTRPLLTRRLFQFLEAWGARHSQGIITLSDVDLEFAKKAGTQAIVRKIPNGVPVRKKGVRCLGLRRNVGFIGRFSREKGLDVIIEAAAMSSQWRWLLAGDGVLPSKLNEHRAELTNAHWLGWMDNSEQFFQQVDIIVQPSYKEGLPYTVLDAMACGIPVVATPVGALPEILSQVDSRLLCPLGDARGLVQAVEFAFEHYDSLARSSYELIKTRYDLEVQLRQTVEMLALAARS